MRLINTIYDDIGTKNNRIMEMGNAVSTTGYFLTIGQ